MQALIDKSHYESFGMTKEERELKRSQNNDSDPDWSSYDKPAIFRLDLK